MKNIKWKILVVTCLLCLVPILLGLAVYDQLPDQVAIHFDINNNPDNFASKNFAVFGLPLIMVLLQIFCYVQNDILAAKFGERKKFSLITKWIIPIMSAALYVATLSFALGYAVDIRRVAILIVGMIFIAIGNYMPKLDYTKATGKRKQISGDKARKINRFLGYSMVIMGIIFLSTIFMPPEASIAALILLIPYTIFAVIMSIKIGKSEE